MVALVGCSTSGVNGRRTFKAMIITTVLSSGLGNKKSLLQLVSRICIS